MMEPYKLNSLDLTMFILKDPVMSSKFGGVIAIDELSVVESNKFYIVNHDPISMIGSHWVVLYNSSIPEHFDSAGHLPVLTLEQTLIANGPIYRVNTNRCQSFVSNTCGVFCLYFCYYRSRGFSFSEIMSSFSNNLLQNEILVLYFYETNK